MRSTNDSANGGTRERTIDDALGRLVDALPAARRWIDETIATHRTRARPLASLELERLPALFPACWFDRVEVVMCDRVPMLPLSEIGLPELGFFSAVNAGGITFRNTIFVQGDQGEERLLFHELVHSIQWDELGQDRFLVSYGYGLLRHGYEGMPLERLAYALELDFDRYVDLGGDPEALVERIRAQAREAWAEVEPHLSGHRFPGGDLG